MLPLILFDSKLSALFSVPLLASDDEDVTELFGLEGSQRTL